MHTIRNLTNSPYDLKAVDDSVVHLPARGSVTLDVHPHYLPLYKSIGLYEVTEAERGAREPAPSPVAPADPIPAPTTEDDDKTLDELRAAARALGVDVDNRWREKRLNEEIAKAAGG